MVLLLLLYSRTQEKKLKGNAFVWFLEGVLVSWLLAFWFFQCAEHGSSAWLMLSGICRKKMCKLGRSNVASLSFITWCQVSLLKDSSFWGKVSLGTKAVFFFF